uniref:Uncharacterized protein n=1 Tax=Sipha flava TaxID=143950 RepID=A0A2S2R0L3_9HEMI
MNAVRKVLRFLNLFYELRRLRRSLDRALFALVTDPSTESDVSYFLCTPVYYAILFLFVYLFYLPVPFNELFIITKTSFLFNIRRYVHFHKFYRLRISLF